MEIPSEGWAGIAATVIAIAGAILKKTGNLKIGSKQYVGNSQPGTWKCGAHDELCIKVDNVGKKVDDLHEDVSDMQASVARVEGYLQGRNNRP